MKLSYILCVWKYQGEVKNCWMSQKTKQKRKAGGEEGQEECRRCFKENIQGKHTALGSQDENSADKDKCRYG